ncbi:MAG TPA: hypothetical protein VF584_11285 [Longimicrobium sp.]|jgi:hypothetical protein
MPDKRVQLLKNLLRKSEEGSVSWEPTAHENEFQANFTGYTLTISQRRGESGSLDEVVSIYNADGVLVEEFDDTELTSVEGFQPFLTMHRIHELARRYAMGAEQALDALLSELSDDLPF